MVLEDYKSNSHKSKEEMQNDRSSEKKVEKVVSGTVKIQKKNKIRKITDVFLSEDTKDVKSYILTDVLIPAVKNTIDDMLTGGIRMIRMMLWGEKESRSKPYDSSYRDYYDKKAGQRRCDAPLVRIGYDYRDLIFDNRGDAEEVLYKMDELISIYDIVSVADLYDLVGKDGSYTDNKYGWKDLQSACVVRTRDGYVLRLPKPLPLN